MWSGIDFEGAKIALLCDKAIVTYLRDDKIGLPHPNQWDLPGGGREGNESPAECALRETEEEFGLRLSSHQLLWMRNYPPRRTGLLTGYFLAANITNQDVRSIRFGDEGQFWKMMPIDTFLSHPQAVPYLQVRLSDYLAGVRG
ncbi:MAG TPA: NUDIX hydrolase [Sphingobium sp.]